MNPTLLAKLKSINPTEGEWAVINEHHIRSFKEHGHSVPIAETYSYVDSCLITLAPEMRQELLKMEEEDLTLRFYEVIQNRINHFESISHTYEANELKQALKSIQKLIPPIMFKIGNTNPTQP